nr:prolyl oligopeptidase family serine peptidase [uncultured Chitinophaga sp.]
MKYIFILIFSLSFTHLSAQKPPIDIDAFENWSTAVSPKITNDGKYVSYYVLNKPERQKVSLVIQGVQKQWKRELVGCGYPSFLDNGRRIAYIQNPDILTLLTLGSSVQKSIPNVKIYTSFKNNGKQYLAYLRKDNTFTILGPNDRDSICYENVDNYIVSEEGGVVILKCKIDSVKYTLKKISLQDRHINEIYNGYEPKNLLLNKNGTKLVFITHEKSESDMNGKLLWCYDHGFDPKAKSRFPIVEISAGSELSHLSRFSDDGTYILCEIRKNSSVKRESSAEPVIWTYADSNLKSRNFDSETGGYGSLGVWNLKDNRLFQVQQNGETFVFKNGIFPKEDNNFRLVYKSVGHRGEWNWNEKSIPVRILLNLSNGSRRQVTEPDDRDGDSYVLSPTGKWIIYFNSELQDYFCYNVRTGERKNITSGISTTWTTYTDDDIPFSKYLNIGVAGFSKDDNIVYLYDQNDIFEIDLVTSRSPINLTQGRGKIDDLVFRFVFSPSTWTGEEVLLSAFSKKTKQDGFYKLRHNGVGRPEKLVMENAMFVGPDESSYFGRYIPIKAEDAPVYLVQKMSAESSPNFYITYDFTKFKQISYVHPESGYNWLKTQLVEFKTRDGKQSQGILYKPENFNPQNKYPIIFYYYEKISESLNGFIRPEPAAGPMNIPYFVSNGYLVFTPDIHFEIGYPGRSSFNTIMGAADTLSRLPYVDSTKMGLQGHSFGGFQTNYIITHTNRFAAACSAAGFTNFVSAYGSIIGSGYSRQGQYELFRDRIGATLWEKPDLYLENSPVFRINKITTPILVMHNNKDDDVLVGQGIEFFTGLRRLGKISYFLQYRGAGHMVGGDAAVDYSRRMLDFFNYYLKGEKLPSWMLNEPPKVLELSLDKSHK